MIHYVLLCERNGVNVALDYIFKDIDKLKEKAEILARKRKAANIICAIHVIHTPKDIKTFNDLQEYDSYFKKFEEKTEKRFF